MYKIKITFKALLFVTIVNLMACSGSKNSKYITIGMVDGWAEGVAMTHIAKAILDEKGYHVIIQKASTDMILASMHNEDTDLFMDVWLPHTHGVKIKKFSDLMELGTSYDNAQIGMVVPAYVTINSIAELNAHQDKFGKSIIGIEKGAGITVATDRAIENYNLNYNQMNSSTIAMITELQNAIKEERWIAVAGWQPHWMFGRMELKFLKDPKKSYGDAEKIKTYARKSFKTAHPDLALFFSKIHFEDQVMAELLAFMEDYSDKQVAAKAWVNTHKNLVDTWL